MQRVITEELDNWEAKYDRADVSIKKAMLINIIDNIEIMGNSLTINFKLNMISSGTLVPIIEEKIETAVEAPVPLGPTAGPMHQTDINIAPEGVCDSQNASINSGPTVGPENSTSECVHTVLPHKR
ncbi:MAG: hypothetical protein FWE03_05150 [Firmicutes bacterium]|nr:hypothetical protein [Bacillota bacterium]